MKQVLRGPAIRVFFLVSVILGLVGNCNAVELLSNRVVPQADGTTLIVLTFDQAITAELAGEEGRILTLNVSDLQSNKFQPDTGGLIRKITVSKGSVTLQATKLVHAVRFPAGAGVVVLEIRPGPIPDPDAPAKRVVKARPKPKPKPAPEPELEPEEPDTAIAMFYTKHFPDRIEAIRDLYEAGYVDQAFDSILAFPPQDSLYGWSRILWGDLLIFNRQFAQSLAPYGEALDQVKTQEVAAIKMAMVYQLLDNDSLSGIMWERALAYMAVKDSLDQLAEIKKPVKKAGGKFPIIPVIIGIIVLALLAGGYLLIRYLQKKRVAKMMALLDEDEGLYAADEPSQTGFRDYPVDDLEAEPVHFEARKEDERVGAGKRVADLYEEDENLVSELNMWNQGSKAKEKPKFTWKTGSGEMSLDVSDHDYSREQDSDSPPPQSSGNPTMPQLQEDPFEDSQPVDPIFDDDDDVEPIVNPNMASWDLEPDDKTAKVPVDNTRDRIIGMHRNGVSVREIAETLKMGQDEVKTILSLAGEAVNV